MECAGVICPSESWHEIGAVAVQDPRAPGRERRRVLAGLHPGAARLDSVQRDVRVVQERVEQPHRVRASSDAGDAGVGQAALQIEHLRAGLAPDHGVEVAHHHRIGMRARHRADDVVRVVDVAHPVAHRLVERILEGPGAGHHRDHLGAQELHAEHVGRLAFDVLRAHVDDALQAEPRGDGRRRHAVLAGPGLGDDAGLAHALREQCLAHGVVHLVRPGMVQVFPLEVHARAADLPRPAMGTVQAATVCPRSA